MIGSLEWKNNFTRNDVWTLVPKPENKSIIRTRRVFRNKPDEQGKMVKKKARLVVEGYNQQEGTNFTETFDLVARLETIRIMLTFAACKNKVFSNGC